MKLPSHRKPLFLMLVAALMTLFGTVCGTTDAGSFVSVSSGSVTSAVSLGSAMPWNHDCGVKMDDSVVCWGNNDYGQPTPPRSSFSSVSAGDNYTCGVKTDGSVVCWGKNDYPPVHAACRFLHFRQRRT